MNERTVHDVPTSLLGRRFARVRDVLRTAAAAAVQMNDFAYGARLAAPSKPGLVKIILPRRFHRNLAHEDGADIRVFTLDGRVVPHVLREAASEGERGFQLFFENRPGQSYILAYRLSLNLRMSPRSWS